MSKRFLALMAVVLFGARASVVQEQEKVAAPDGMQYVKMTTSLGPLFLQLNEAKAPKTVANFLSYVDSGHYEGTIFHRVIRNFMVQGGGMLEDYTEKPGTKDPIGNEADNGLKNDYGTISMARTGDPNSATSQFFINCKDNTFLNHTSKTRRNWGYCVFGKVVGGIDTLEKIRVTEVEMDPRADRNSPAKPVETVFIEKVARVKADDPELLAAEKAYETAMKEGKMYVKMDTTLGPMFLELDKIKAPKTVENFRAYVDDGYYEGTIFHRVIKDFMAQGGGMLPDYSRKPGTKDQIMNEADNGLKNVYGTLAMARTGDPHSASSQFFINCKDNGFLDHKAKNPAGWGYCVFGKVVGGLDTLGRIRNAEVVFDQKADQSSPAKPVVPIVIEKATAIEADDPELQAALKGSWLNKGLRTETGEKGWRAAGSPTSGSQEKQGT